VEGENQYLITRGKGAYEKEQKGKLFCKEKSSLSSLMEKKKPFFLLQLGKKRAA